MTLSTYGLAAFEGVQAFNEINNQLAAAIVEIYGKEDQEKGARALQDVLGELFKKVDAISSGYTNCFRMFSVITVNKEQRDKLMIAVYNILSKHWRYKVELDIEQQTLSLKP